MNLKSTVAMLVLACAAGAGVATPAGAASLAVGDILSGRHVTSPDVTADQPQLWQVQRRRRRHHHRRHRHGPDFGFYFGLPFGALAPRYEPPPPAYYPPPAAPAWRFDGRHWVCDYVDSYGRPLCR